MPSVAGPDFFITYLSIKWTISAVMTVNRVGGNWVAVKDPCAGGLDVKHGLLTCTCVPPPISTVTHAIIRKN